MGIRENCIKCGRVKPQEEGTHFCQDCKNKIINYCWNYHQKLQNQFILTFNMNIEKRCVYFDHKILNIDNSIFIEKDINILFFLKNMKIFIRY